MKNFLRSHVVTYAGIEKIALESEQIMPILMTFASLFICNFSCSFRTVDQILTDTVLHSLSATAELFCYYTSDIH